MNQFEEKKSISKVIDFNDQAVFEENDEYTKKYYKKQ